MNRNALPGMRSESLLLPLTSIVRSPLLAGPIRPNASLATVQCTRSLPWCFPKPFPAQSVHGCLAENRQPPISVSKRHRVDEPEFDVFRVLEKLADPKLKIPFGRKCHLRLRSGGVEGIQRTGLAAATTKNPHPHLESETDRGDAQFWYFRGVPLGLDMVPGISGAGRTRRRSGKQASAGVEAGGRDYSRARRNQKRRGS